MIETQVSKGIISTYFDKLQRNLDLALLLPQGVGTQSQHQAGDAAEVPAAHPS